jgi:hypothetical protein
MSSSAHLKRFHVAWASLEHRFKGGGLPLHSKGTNRREDPHAIYTATTFTGVAIPFDQMSPYFGAFLKASTADEHVAVGAAS